MSADLAEKAIAALARHERAQQRVAGLSERIGAAISRCPVVVKSNDWSISNAERAEIWDEKTGRLRTHLWMVYNARAVYGEHFDSEGQQDALHPRNGGCRHCLRAWRLIRDRSIARRELGIAKRVIRQLGKTAILQEENSCDR